jgi:hypothetical protein
LADAVLLDYIGIARKAHLVGHLSVAEMEFATFQRYFLPAPAFSKFYIANLGRDDPISGFSIADTSLAMAEQSSPNVAAGPGWSQKST